MGGKGVEGVKTGGGNGGKMEEGRLPLSAFLHV